MSERKIDVLVAEDSTVTRTFLVQLLELDPQIRVIGAVADGNAALDFVKKNKPDVVLMDIYMPGLDGFEATRRIMETQPLPIVICSAIANIKDTVVTFQALEAGAIACIAKPVGREHDHFESMAAHLLETVKLMSEVKVVRRSTRSRTARVPAVHLPEWHHTSTGVRLIGIGASTGGPPVLQTILAGLPKDFPAPVLVVQHIARGFVAGMAEWLNQNTALQVDVAGYGTHPLPGHVYLAPDDFHMCVDAGGRIILSRDEPQNHLRPSVSYLFRSLAELCGPSALGVLLTGMGTDGADGLKAMKDSGAITIAQDRESSVVHGMPGAAIALGAATHVLPGEKIGGALLAMVDRKYTISRN